MDAKYRICISVSYPDIDHHVNLMLPEMDTDRGFFQLLGFTNHFGNLLPLAFLTWLNSWVIADCMGRNYLSGYTAKIVSCLVMSSSDQSTDLALQCMIECVADTSNLNITSL
eukprot:8853057-Ditylum_brightwellii.AAC.1